MPLHTISAVRLISIELMLIRQARTTRQVGNQASSIYKDRTRVAKASSPADRQTWKQKRPGHQARRTDRLGSRKGQGIKPGGQTDLEAEKARASSPADRQTWKQKRPGHQARRTDRLGSRKGQGIVVDLTKNWEEEGKKHRSHHHKRHDGNITSCWIV